MPWLESAKIIVEEKSAKRLDPNTGEILGSITDIDYPTELEEVEELYNKNQEDHGVILDYFSAQIMLQVYDVLSDENKESFKSMNLLRAHDIAFELLNNTKR